eukprot:10306173-Lingulodinium_polyedra.AAC.1
MKVSRKPAGCPPGHDAGAEYQMMYYKKQHAIAFRRKTGRKEQLFQVRAKPEMNEEDVRVAGLKVQAMLGEGTALEDAKAELRKLLLA